ncbi:mechanosensitive ion channel domain-containing protein [Endothiovibrio diazotrophicus]
MPLPGRQTYIEHPHSDPPPLFVVEQRLQPAPQRLGRRRPLSAVCGAIGLALRDSLKNFAAGVMLIVFRPFKAGDFIEAAGTMGDQS